MERLTVIEETRSQAKMTFHKGEVVIKLPFSLPVEEKDRIRTAFLKVFEKHQDHPYPLKVAYKSGTPYLYVNRAGKDNKQETLFSYPIANL